MHRPTIGLIAISLLTVGLGTHLHGDENIASPCLRIGTVMVILWFAEPELRYVPRWLAVTIVVMLLIVMRWPRLLLAAVPIAALLWFLRPRESRLSKARRQRPLD